MGKIKNGLLTNFKSDSIMSQKREIRGDDKMAVIRVNKTKDYTVMSNTHLKDKNLSLKAKGLLSIMLSLPDGWNYSIEGLIAICKEGEKALVSALEELKKNKYLVTTKLYPNQTKSKRIEYVYDIFENPKNEKQDPQNVGLENVGLQNVHLQNAGQLNTKNKKTKNKEKVNKKKNANFEQREYTEEELRKLYNNI